MAEIRILPNYRPIVTVSKRGARYQAYYRLPPQHGEDRIQMRVLLRFTKRADAEVWASMKQIALINGVFEDRDYAKMRVDPPRPQARMTFNEFLPIFRQHRDRGRGRKTALSPRYIQDQDRQIERFLIPRFGDCPLEDIEDAIDSFVEELSVEEHPLAKPKLREDGTVEREHRLSNATINHILGHLSRVLSIAFKKKKISRRPIIEKQPEEHDDDFDFLEKDELLRLLAACKGPYGNMIKLIALTGARAMEASGLMWQDYDPVKKRLRIERQLDHRSGPKDKKGKTILRFRPPKWNSKRWIEVPATLAEVLREQAAATRLQDGLIFQTEEAKPVVHELLRRRLQQACRRAGLRTVAPHVLRRTFISHRIMAGDNPVNVQRLAGHRSMQVTIRYYTRLGVAFTQEAASRFEEYLFGNKERLAPDEATGT